jgi:threonine dehydrogenase-like Zn-dependent dehydrogenase
LVFKEIDEPTITSPDDVKIKIICNTIGKDDARLYREDDFYSKTGVVGYEMTGIVTDLGEQAEKEGFAVGQHVSGSAIMFCGKCAFCRRNKHNCCISMKINRGTLCEYIVCKSSQLVRVPANIDARIACLVEPIAAAIEAVERLRLRMGNTVCIMGGDFEGLILQQLAKMHGASEVTVVDALEHNRRLAKRLGASHVLDPMSDTPYANELYRLTDFNGFDAIVEAVGKPDYFRVALDLANKGGTILLMKYHYETNQVISANLTHLIINNITVSGSFLYNRDKLELAANLLPSLQLDILVEEAFTFENAIHAFELLKAESFPRIAITM